MPSADEPPNYQNSPYRGVTDGNGQTIPCRCRFGSHAYKLGETVCMATAAGMMLTRCDLLLNNTSWVPTRVPCELSERGPGAGEPGRLASMSRALD